MTAKTIISAAIPCSPKLFSKLIKLFVTCEPKKATLGPNNISAITDTPNKRTPSSRNLFKYDFIFEIQLFIINYPIKKPLILTRKIRDFILLISIYRGSANFSYIYLYKLRMIIAAINPTIPASPNP